MIWKMRDETAQRLEALHVAKAREKTRAELDYRLTGLALSFSLLSDKAQNDFVSRMRTVAKHQEQVFETPPLALVSFEVLTRRCLPELCLFASWNVNEGAAALLKRDDGLRALKNDPTVFSLDGCVIASPDGVRFATFDFDVPWKCGPAYVHLLGEGWPAAPFD